MNHMAAQERMNLKRTRQLLGDEAHYGDQTDSITSEQLRQQRLVEQMPSLISSLVSDMRMVAKKAEFHREFGGPLDVEHAFEMQEIIVRATAISFMLCHVRPSLVERAAIYLSDERHPPCRTCGSAECPECAFIVHRTKDNLLLVAPHHKTAKGKAKAEPITMKTDAHWMVSLFREWAMWGQALAYTGALPDDAYTDPKYRSAGRFTPRRPLLQYAAVRGAEKGVFRDLRSGDATDMLRRVTGWKDVVHKDFRHAFITVVQDITLSPARHAALLAAATRKGPLPEWMTQRVARGLGNSLNMWHDTYDAGECPVDAETTLALLNAQRKHLLLLAALGKGHKEELDEGEELNDPEKENWNVYDGDVSWVDEAVGDDDGEGAA
jgi:hypothetical protein